MSGDFARVKPMDWNAWRKGIRGLHKYHAKSEKVQPKKGPEKQEMIFDEPAVVTAKKEPPANSALAALKGLKIDRELNIPEPDKDLNKDLYVSSDDGGPFDLAEIKSEKRDPWRVETEGYQSPTKILAEIKDALNKPENKVQELVAGRLREYLSDSIVNDVDVEKHLSCTTHIDRKGRIVLKQVSLVIDGKKYTSDDLDNLEKLMADLNRAIIRGEV